ncbi:MAG: serine hydrolase, partial [Bacteroidota bacterium]
AQNPLNKVFANDDFLKKLGNNRDKHQIQVVYTQIDRKEDQTPVLTTYEWGTDSSLYYYPASTVKMPAAFLALEKINQLNIVGLDAHSKLEIGAGGEPQTPFSYDSTAADGTASIAQFIKEIFVVSDNNAHNRLYEFIGQEQFNRALHRKGFTNTRLVHRLGPGGFPFDPETNQGTNPITFFDESGEMLYFQGEVSGRTPFQLTLENEIMGKAHMRNGELIGKPFDFSEKNFFALRDMHDVLQAVIFPDITPAEQRFDLSAAQYAFLYEWMCKLPEASGIAQYAGKSDSYVKFFMFGDREEETIPDHIKIFNKVGWAYGFLTDVSYIIDQKEGLEFFLAATIHVNENETYNDGKYQYEEVGLPFFGALGRAIYELEKGRPRSVVPDLTSF